MKEIIEKHIWLDDEEMSWICIAVTKNDPQLTEELTEGLALLNGALKDHKLPHTVSVEEAVRPTPYSWD